MSEGKACSTMSEESFLIGALPRKRFRKENGLVLAHGMSLLRSDGASVSSNPHTTQHIANASDGQ